MTYSLTPQQQQILKMLAEGDRHRLDLLRITADNYQALQQVLIPLISQDFVTYHFDEDTAQRFCLTPQGRRVATLIYQ